MSLTKSIQPISLLAIAAACLLLFPGCPEGNTPSNVSVPNLSNLTQAGAQAALAAAGLTTGTVTQQYSASVAAGRVISQAPGAGTVVAKGTPVNFVVSLGPNPTPDLSASLTTLSLSSASATGTVTITNAGQLTLSWTASSSDPLVTVSPGSHTGNSQAVTLTATDFSQSFAANVTFTNDSDASDTATVQVIVIGTTASQSSPGDTTPIPDSDFDMGDPWDEGYPDEGPVQELSLSGYDIGLFEVTNQEYADALSWAYSQGLLSTVNASTVVAYGQELLDLDDSACQISWNGSQFVVESRDSLSMADHPVVEVSWYGAAAYCNWVSAANGLAQCYNTSTWDVDISLNGWRLPTEAEWEQAAAWDGTRFWRYGFMSDSIDATRANYNGNNPLGLTSVPYTTPAGYYDGVNAGTANSQSPKGCFDMSGNVAEWCHDWYGQDYYSTRPTTNPAGPATGSARVFRGGGYPTNAYGVRCSNRGSNSPTQTSEVLGFRVARTR